MENNINGEFAIHLAKYISQNNEESKKYIDSFWKEFGKIPDSNVRLAYRFWDFPDYQCLKMLNGSNIPINTCSFLSYYTNVANTKNMIEFLEYDDPTKIIYIVELRKGTFKSIYKAFEHMNDNELTSDEVSFIDKTINDFKIENEHIRTEIKKYNLNNNNSRFIIIHHRLAELLEYKDFKKINNGYYIYEVSPEFINFIQENEIIKEIMEQGDKVNFDGVYLLDKYHQIAYDNLEED